MKKSVVVAVSFVSVFILILSQSGLSGYVGDVSTWYYTPSQESSYVIGLYNSTHYYLQNHTGYGLAAYEGYEYMSINASALFQYVFTSLSSTGGTIYVKQGLYELNYNVSYADGVTFTIIGEGSRINRYTPTATAGSTILYFDRSNFIDAQHTTWNAGYTMMVLRNIAFVFDAGNDDPASGAGLWLGKVTLPDFDGVNILVKGNHTDNREILFGRATGATGRTAIWRNVVIDAQMYDGSYVTVARLNYDTFIWDGGSLWTDLSQATFDTRLIRLETTMGGRVAEVSVYRDDHCRIGAYFWLTPDNWGLPYKFENIAFYDNAGQYANITYHFTSSEGLVLIQARFVSSSGALKLNDVEIVSSQQSSIVVDTDGTNCWFTKDDGSQPYSSTNASALILSAFAASAGEGKILFKNGIYHLDSPLTISYAIFNIVLEGESWPEDLASSSATWRGVVLEKDFNGDLLTITGPTQYSLYAQFEIKNLGFSSDGDVYTGACIVVSNCSFFNIDKVRINRFENNGIRITYSKAFRIRDSMIYACGHTSAGAYLDHVSDTQILDLEICQSGPYYNDSRCVALEVGYSSWVDVIGGHFEGYNGIRTNSSMKVVGATLPWAYSNNFYATFTGVTLVGCSFLGANDGQLAADTGANVRTIAVKMSVVGCYFLSVNATYGFYGFDGSESNIIGNNFDGTFFIAPVLPTDEFVTSNIGYVTENSVSGSNTTATTAVINHGLAASATNVQCSFNFTGWTSWTWTSDATQITVTVTGTLPASWTTYIYAVYKP